MTAVTSSGAELKGSDSTSASVLSFDRTETAEILRAYIDLAFAGDPEKPAVLAQLGYGEEVR